MPSWLLSLLSGPIIGALVDAYKAKLAAGNTTEQIAADLAGKELSLQQAQAQYDDQVRIAEIGKWYEPDHLMGYAVAFYVAKCLVWDAALGLGTTDPVKGLVANTVALIIAFYYGKRSAESVARIIAAIFRKGN